MLVFSASREGREEAGPGEWPREEAIEGRGEDNVDMVGGEEVNLKVKVEMRRLASSPSGGGPVLAACLLLALLSTSTFQHLLAQTNPIPQWPAQSK
jgi:hypothetical protein